MAEFIVVADLPASLQGAELVVTMVAGANAKASRVAPCLVAPTSTVWVAATAYVVGSKVALTADQFLEVTIAGTSAATIPTVPGDLGGTVTDGSVTWTRIAPGADQLAEARLILLGAVKRWAEAGSGAYSQQTAGPFGVSVDTRQKSSGFNLWPSEIVELQGICSAGQPGRQSYSIDTAPASSTHVPWCSLMLGALYCSCGADLTNYEYPLFEGYY